MASAPSGSTGASSTDEQFRPDRPVRPSEMKDEGCVFPSRSQFILLLYPSCLYVKTKKRRMGGGRVCALPPTSVFLCPDSLNSTEKQCVSYLAVVSTRTRVVSPLHLLATCFYQMLWRASMASPSLTCYPSLSIFLHRILATPRCQNLLPFSAMSLCYAYAYAYPPLCISTSVAYLPSGTTRHILTARCLSAAYPGIQQMVLFYLFFTHTRYVLCPFFAMSCPFC
jgi:hypothetical protein